MAAYPRRVHGIDFSGAADAGRRIWIASGAIESHRLRIDACRRAEALPGSGRERDICLTALRNFIAGEKACAVGLDFPFGLPASLMGTPSWDDFIHSFPNRYPSPQQFREQCVRTAGGGEQKRATDIESRAPFSPYNLRLYRQTYYGIRDVLHPLVRDGQACVRPMQRAQSGKPWLFEICPASTLKRLSLYAPYKGRTKAHSLARKRILGELEKNGGLSVPSSARAILIEESNGDAPDSVIAAWTTFQALRHPEHLTARDNAHVLEGRIYM